MRYIRFNISENPVIHVHSTAVVLHNNTFSNYIRVVCTRFPKLCLFFEYRSLPEEVLPAFAIIEDLELCAINECCGNFNPQSLTLVELILVDRIPNLRALSIRCANDSKIMPVLARSSILTHPAPA